MSLFVFFKFFLFSFFRFFWFFLFKCISHLFFSPFFFLGAHPIEHGTLITNSIESLNVSFLFNVCIDGSSEQVVLTSTLTRQDPSR